MKKINWVNFHTRSFGLFRYWVYIESNKLPFYKKNFGKVFDYTLTVPNGKLVGYHHDNKELDDMTNRIFRVSCKNFKTFERYSDQIFGWMKNFIEFNNKLNKETLSKMSNKQLLNLFDKWYQKCLYWHTGVYFFFVLEPITTELFLTKLEEYLKKEKKMFELNHYSEIIMSPERMNAVAQEQKMALETAIKIKKVHSKKKDFINKYYKSFLWIPCYDIHDKEYDFDHFENQIEKLLKFSLEELQIKLNNLVNDFKSRNFLFKNIVKEIKDKELVELSNIIHWLIYYKDYRDDLRREAGFASKKFMSELANRLGLTLEEVDYLIPSEIKSWLKGAQPITISEIRKRIPTNYVLRSLPGKIELFTGDKVGEVLKKELEDDKKNVDSILKGVIGSKGIARGKVSIVRHSVSLSKVKEGDVLVAITTHPEYVPAMKKCCAIVTDEGGITSHAAIVARELGKPCVVATKRATRLLKDGDMIEVDANTGIIKKL